MSDRPQGVAFALSVLIHAIAFVALMYGPAVKFPARAESEYKQAIAGKEDKIVWYKFPKRLPKVVATHARTEKRPLRAATKAIQSIVSSPKDAPKRSQMVWTPAPELRDTPPLESPNLLAIKVPDLPPPLAKPFVAPPEPPKRDVAKLDLPDAPQLKPQPAAPTAELRRPALPPKPFMQPPATLVLPVAKPMVAPDAPQIQTQPARTAELPVMRLPPKPYVAPQPVVRRAIARSAPLAEAPALAATLNSDAPGMMGPAPRLPPKPFTAPAIRTGTASSRSAAVETPPALPPVDLPANSKDLNIAVVGLNPADKPAPLPSASNPANFSAGRELRPDGAKSEAGKNGLNVPDLFVPGVFPRDSREAEPDLIAQAYAAATAPETVRAAIQQGKPMMIVHTAPPPATHAGATKVSGAPDPRFNGRDVYLMAIQMPNLTSYSGSWLMWYSDRTAREAGIAPVSPPVPHRKVDPKYVATAVEERVEGRVQLACVIDQEGRVSTVELVRGIDDRLNRSAEEALSKWEFYPATRNGAPVDVDVLVEIPFRIAPRIPGR